MRWMMTWMMAAALFLSVSALPGCEAPEDSHSDGSGNKADTTTDQQKQEGSKDKNASDTGSGSR